MAEVLAIHLSSPSVLPYLLIAAHLLLAPFLVLNIRYVGTRLIMLGFTLNLLVMLANGGLMPVEMAAVQAVGKHDGQELVPGEHIDGTKNVLLESDAIHLRPLADVIVLPVPQPFTRAISAGDIAVLAGLGALGLTLSIARLRART